MDDPETSFATATVLTEVERRAVVDAVSEAISANFGSHARETSKLFCWSILSGKLEVAVLKSNCGTVVLPFDSTRDARPYFGEIDIARRSDDHRQKKRGRSANLAHSSSPSLGWDRDLIYLRPLTKWELERTIELIRDKSEGRSIEDRRPPSDDVSLALLGFVGMRFAGSGLISKIRAVYHRDGGRCQMCGSTEKLHVDHQIPRAKGGSDEIENLWVLCSRCNLSKTDTI